MPGLRCAVFNCNNSRIKTKEEGGTIIYHTFPKGKDLITSAVRKEWIQRCNRDGKFKPDSSRICSIHFTIDDYERDLQNELLGLPLKKKLKKTATPTLHIPFDLISKRPDILEPKIEIEECEVLANGERRTVVLLENNFPEIKMESTTDTHFNQSNTNNLILTGNDISEFSLLSEKYQKLLKDFNILKTEYSLLKQKSARKIKSLNDALNYYKKKSATLSICDKKKAELDLLRTVLTENQIAVLSKKKKRVNWTQDEIDIAFTIWDHSKKTYLYLKNKLCYPLPGLSTLRRYRYHANKSTNGIDLNPLQFF